MRTDEKNRRGRHGCVDKQPVAVTYLVLSHGAVLTLEGEDSSVETAGNKFRMNACIKVVDKLDDQLDVEEKPLLAMKSLRILSAPASFKISDVGDVQSLLREAATDSVSRLVLKSSQHGRCTLLVAVTTGTGSVSLNEAADSLRQMLGSPLMSSWNEVFTHDGLVHLAVLIAAYAQTKNESLESRTWQIENPVSAYRCSFLWLRGNDGAYSPANRGLGYITGVSFMVCMMIAFYYLFDQGFISLQDRHNSGIQY